MLLSDESLKKYQTSNTHISRLRGNDYEQLLDNVRNINLGYRNCLNLPRDITFGVEIEFQEALYDIIYDSIKKLSCGWEVKTDETVTRSRNIGYIGGEIASLIFTDNPLDWQDLENVCKILNQNNAIASDDTGGHIHIGSQIFEENSKILKRFLKLIIIYERIIYRFGYGEFLGPRKVINSYAYPISYYLYRRIDEINACDNFYSMVSLLKCLGFGSSSAINFNNIKKPTIFDKNTVEARFFNGTINHCVWQNNINFIIRLFLYAASDEYDEDFIDYNLQRHYDYTYNNLEYYNDLYISEALELCDMIFDNDLDKLYFLRQYLKDFKPHEDMGITKKIKL